MSDPGDPDRTKVQEADPYAGKILDRRYRIEYRLATGGFGAVYRARHAINGREVAVKILHAKHLTDAGVAARFRREAAALGQLKNPHVVTAYDFGEAADGTLYIVMELLSGVSLFEEFRARGALAWRRVCGIMRQVCEALGEAHRRGIVHRDLKPQNIHLEQRGEARDYVKVLDFGIAKILQGSALDAQGLTHAGQVIGTFEYMAPEQLVGGEITRRSDLFTVGIVLYEMIVGEHPFGVKQTPAAQISAILAGGTPSVSSRAAVPAELDAAVARCLQWDSEERYRNAEELAADLDEALASDEGSLTHVMRTPPRFGFGDAPEPTTPGFAPPRRKR